MSTPARQLRRRVPYLTPPFAGDDGETAELLRRIGLPQIPTDDGAAPPLQRPLLTAAPVVSEPEIPALSRAELPPPVDPVIPVVTAPTRIGSDELAAIGAPPMVISRDGRPTAKFIGEGTPEERLLTQRRALEVYEPKKESKKHLFARILLGQLRGGLVGEGGSLDTLIGPGGVMDRRGVDEAWKQRQLGGVNTQLGQMRTDRRAGLQDDLLESQVRENQAQAQRALREPTAPPIKPPAAARRIPPVKQVDEDGNEYLADADTGEPLLDAKGNRRYTGRAKAPSVKPDTGEFTNEQISRTIGEIEAEQKTLGPSPPTEIADTNQFGEVVGKKTNPAYLDWAHRYRALDDKKRELQMKRKPTAPAVTRSSGVTEQTIRDAAKAKNLDPDAAVKRARARGMIR